MNPPSVPSSSKLPENNIEACEQAGTLPAARRAVSRVQDAVITAQIQTVDEPLAAAMTTALDQVCGRSRRSPPLDGRRDARYQRTPRPERTWRDSMRRARSCTRRAVLLLTGRGACGTPGCIPCTAADLIESQAADLPGCGKSATN